MLSFGSTDSHNNSLDLGDLATLEGNVLYAVGMWVKELGASAAAAFVFADGRLTISTDAGYALERTSTAYRVRHGDGAAMAAVDFTASMADGETHSLYYSWHAAATNFIRFYFDGVFVGQSNLNTQRATNALAWILGNNTNKDDGYACQIGHFMYWHNFSQSVEEADLNAAVFHQGQFIPRPDKLTFWHKGLASPGADEIAGTVPTAGGTVTVVSDAIDSYYSPRFEQAPLLASHRLMRRRTEEQIYGLEVPIGHANIELMDLINVSHDSLPLSASRLTGLSGGLVKQWQRFVALAVGISLNPMSRTISLKFKDHESFMATYWSTDVLPEGTNDQFNGLARLGVGGALTVDRPNFAYLEQANDVKVEISQATEGEFFRRVAVANEKMNHVGFLSEDTTDNPIINNCAKNGETSWSSTDNGGTTTLSTLRKAYPSSVTTQSWTFARSDDANDTFRSQNVAVLTADAFRRIYIVKSEEDADTIVSWRLQRNSDSQFWNDATPGWQVASVWNNLPNSYDAGSSLSIISRHYSNIIDIGADETWSINVGLEGASLPAGGGEANIYSVSALKGYLVYSEVPTDAAAVTTNADIVKRVKTSGSQQVSALRGSLTFEFEAIQAGGDLADGDELCLYYWQYGSTEGDDYDAVIYEKQSAETVRLSYVRVIGGSLDARAFYELDVIRGITYKVAALWTDDSNDDFSAGNSLLRIYVDEAQGTDDNASANHDDAEGHTEIWFGCAPAATGYRNGMNYTRHTRFQPRPLSNEEVLI